MADLSQLSQLTRRADSVAESASALVQRTMREIRGELANLSSELNLAGSAADREKVYAEIRRRMALLSRRMNTLMEAQNELAARGAAKSASAMTGLEVKYSPSRAKAICELVTPAQGENIAAVFTDRMGRALINALREATVATLREQAVSGGTMKDMSRDLATRWAKAAKMENPHFTDSAGHIWDTKTYIQMNVRTNTMRVYNDCLADDIARETGSDLARISVGGDPDCDCAAWEGCIISISGKTKGFPSYDDARNGGCFHPNCTHTLEYIDEAADADEIALQKSVPAEADMAGDYDAQDERKYQIDQARYMRDNPGMSQEEARLAVDRDNLALSIQSGLVRDDAKEIVARMTDAQVTALCPDGNPPAFEPTKKATKADPHAADEKWNHGKYGGVVHIARNADLEKILEVCKVKDAVDIPPAPPEKSDGPVDFDSLPADQRSALKWYVSGEGQYINQAMRGRVGADFGELTADEKAAIAAMQAATDHPLAKDIATLYRSVDARAVFGNISQTQYDMLCDYFRSTGADRKYYERQIGDIISRTNGKELVEKGFMSTTRDKGIALDWGGFTGSDKPITIELKIAPGVRGIDLRKLDVADMPQREVLLHPGVKYRVIEISHVDGVPYVKAEIITSPEKPSAKPEPKNEEPKPKTVEEIKAMDVVSAVRETEKLVAHLASVPIPPTITARENRLERMDEIYYTRWKARKAADDKVRKIDKVYWRETDYDKRVELRRQLDAAVAERSALHKKCVRAWKLKDSIETKLFKESLPWAEPLIVHGKANCTINTGSVSRDLPKWKDAKTLLQKIVAPEVFPQDAISVRKLKDGSRAFCRAGAINMTASDKIPTFIHETMHFIESYNPHVHNRCVDFLKHRTDGEAPQLLRKAANRDWYDSTERTRKDNFFDPYCGKLYEHPERDGSIKVSATEVLSMGVERLVQNPVRFLREDKEYATMCLNLIRGNL